MNLKKLNDITVKERRPLPVIRDVLEKLSKEKVFSKLDACAGYWQCDVEESC